MASTVRPEMKVEIGGKEYALQMTFGALGRLEVGLGVEGFAAMQERLQKVRFQDMPIVMKAILEGNGLEVPAEDIERMDPMEYLENVLPNMFRRGNAADENPTKGQRKKS